MMTDIVDKVSMGIFKRRIGKTPLLRATELEKRLGVKEIYLKLEGTNPTGHKSDRIAYTTIKDAMESEKNILTIGTVGYLAMSLGRLAEGSDMRCVFYVPRLTKKLRHVLEGLSAVEVVETGGTYERAVAESRRNAQMNGWYDANPGLENSFMAMMAYSPIASEILFSLGKSPSTISVPVGNGSLLSGIHLGFRQLWASGDIKSMPRIFGGSIEGQNAVVWSYNKGLKEIQPLSGTRGRTSTAFNPLVNMKGLGGQHALDALYDSRGKAYDMTASELTGLSRTLRDTDNVRVTSDSASALGAFIKAAEEGLIVSEEKHVIVLSTGRTDLSIRILERDALDGGLSRLIDNLDKWLQRFTDPREEMLEAVENAFDEGYVIGAFMGNDMVGICVLSTMELDTFFPRYHMSYIAAEEGTKGRGVATQLFEYALRLSKGNLSLHVEVDNKKAIRLYKKMGMDVKYYRMAYRGSKDDAEN